MLHAVVRELRGVHVDTVAPRKDVTVFAHLQNDGRGVSGTPQAAQAGSSTGRKQHRQDAAQAGSSRTCKASLTLKNPSGVRTSPRPAAYAVAGLLPMHQKTSSNVCASAPSHANALPLSSAFVTRLPSTSCTPASSSRLLRSACCLGDAPSSVPECTTVTVPPAALRSAASPATSRPVCKRLTRWILVFCYHILSL